MNEREQVITRTDAARDYRTRTKSARETPTAP